MGTCWGFSFLGTVRNDFTHGVKTGWSNVREDTTNYPLRAGATPGLHTLSNQLGF